MIEVSKEACGVFVDELRKLIKPEEYFAMCAMAAKERMGFGKMVVDWGDLKTGCG